MDKIEGITYKQFRLQNGNTNYAYNTVFKNFSNQIKHLHSLNILH